MTYHDMVLRWIFSCGFLGQDNDELDGVVAQTFKGHRAHGTPDGPVSPGRELSHGKAEGLIKMP